MFDLAITESGDLYFLEEENKKEDFKISFNVSTGKALKISFKIDNSNTLGRRTEQDLMVSFKVKEIENNKKALTVDNNNALIQAIRIRLMTSLGEMSHKENFGSKLELIKHGNLHDKSIHAEAEKIIQEAIFDILPKATIKIKPIINHEQNYSQCLCVYIYKENKVIYKHIL